MREEAWHVEVTAKMKRKLKTEISPESGRFEEVVVQPKTSEVLLAFEADAIIHVY